jgi:RNA polymerase sigma-70 factor (ECF subfamily)
VAPAPLHQIGEIKLVRLCQAAGDTGAFEELVRRHRAALVDFLTSVCRQRQDAEDIAQSALVKAFMRIRRFDGRSAFRTWLCAIGYREFLMHARSQRAHRRILDRLRGEVRPATTGDPDWPIDIRNALDGLSPDEQRGVVLCDIGGLTHAEAAKLLGVPLGTLKSQIKRAKARLADTLGPPEEKAP